jgi:hypothetical protein
LSWCCDSWQNLGMLEGTHFSILNVIDLITLIV